MITDDELDEIQARADAAIVDGYPDYEVDRRGNVYSLLNWRGYGRRAVTPVTEHGYLKVRLRHPDGRRVKLFVHRIVAQAFCGPCEAGDQVRHLNGDPFDNRAKNLAWGSAKENAKDRDVHGTTARGSRNGFSKLTEDRVREIRRRLEGGESQRSVARGFGVSQKTVWRIANGGWSHVG